MFKVGKKKKIKPPGFQEKKSGMNLALLKKVVVCFHFGHCGNKKKGRKIEYICKKRKKKRTPTRGGPCFQSFTMGR